MSIQYHVYANNGAGGPIDWATIVATVSGLTWTSGTLALSSDTTYGIRAYDTVAALEEQSIDATARILLDGSGADITNRPLPVANLTASVKVNGSIALDWVWFGPTNPTPLTGFKVYGGTPTISYSSPLATIPYSAGRNTFRTTLAGLTDGSSYQIGVRAYNATGDDGSLSVVTIVADATGPVIVDNFVVSVTP